MAGGADVGGWWSKVCQAPENWAPGPSVPHLGSPCSHGHSHTLPGRPQSPGKGWQVGLCAGEDTPAPRPGWGMSSPSTDSATGGTAGVAGPCRPHPALRAPASPVSLAGGAQLGFSTCLFPDQAEAFTAASRQSAGTGRRGPGSRARDASARHPAEPHGKACSPKNARRGCGNHTRRALGPRHLSPDADLSLASGHLTREAPTPGQCT